MIGQEFVVGQVVGQFRIGHLIGPAYLCQSCGLSGFRLWRAISSCVELTCFSCSEADQKDQVLRDQRFGEDRRQVIVCTIGDLVPARRDPEDRRWWNHTSGGDDWAWWTRMPQHADMKREAELLKYERDHLVRFADRERGRR